MRFFCILTLALLLQSCSIFSDPTKVSGTNLKNGNVTTTVSPEDGGSLTDIKLNNRSILENPIVDIFPGKTRFEQKGDGDDDGESIFINFGEKGKYSLSKSIILKSNGVLSIQYNIKNQGKEALKFSWKSVIDTVDGRKNQLFIGDKEVKDKSPLAFNKELTILIAKRKCKVKLVPKYGINVIEPKDGKFILALENGDFLLEPSARYKWKYEIHITDLAKNFNTRVLGGIYHNYRNDDKEGFQILPIWQKSSANDKHNWKFLMGLFGRKRELKSVEWQFLWFIKL